LTWRGEKTTQNDDENGGRPSEDFVFSTPTEVQFISLILIRVLERLDSFHMTSHSVSQTEFRENFCAPHNVRVQVARAVTPNRAGQSWLRKVYPALTGDELFGVTHYV
jgi:hypothetical protein